MENRICLIYLLIALSVITPVMADTTPEAMNSAGGLYTQSVDLANEGKYQQALDTADKALAMNVTSLIPLIQSNRAGILVMLNRNDEAITAADAALAVQGDLTSVHSIAWYNKGNALRNLGRLAEAKEAYSQAYALDKTLVPPDLGVIPNVVTKATVSTGTATMTVPSALPSPAPTKSPVSLIPVISALGVTGYILVAARKNP